MLIAGTALQHAQPLAKARQCLWKVDGRTNHVYFFGTIHFSNTNFFPLPKPIEDAYTQAQIVIFETDLYEDSSPEALSKTSEQGKYPEGDSLKNHLSKEVYARAQSYLLGEGGQGSELDSMKPFLAAYSIANHATKKFGFDMLKSVDRYIFTKAKEDKKQIIPFESYDSALRALTGLTEKGQEAMLEEMLSEAESRTIIPAVAAAWKNGDTNKIETFLLDGLRKNPELGRRILTDRNKNWTDGLEKIIMGGTNAFVAVGVGHLIGKDSLIDLLSKRGIKVTQM